MASGPIGSSSMAVLVRAIPGVSTGTVFDSMSWRCRGDVPSRSPARIDYLTDASPPLCADKGPAQMPRYARRSLPPLRISVALHRFTGAAAGRGSATNFRVILTPDPPSRRSPSPGSRRAAVGISASSCFSYPIVDPCMSHQRLLLS